MNYRHAFHAGNFADVIKHAILSRIVVHLRRKESPFRVIDTHAGAGLYDLTAPEAVRNPEWRTGIGHLLEATIDPAAQDLLSDYLGTVRAANPDGQITRYPGSPRSCAPGCAARIAWSRANLNRPRPRPCHTTFAATGA